MKVTTYKQARAFLESFIRPTEFKDKSKLPFDPLARMRYLLDILGNPQNRFPSVLIAGTAGKGSTAYLLSRILSTAGYKTGLTLSPHLQKINERLQINNKHIPDEVFVDLVNTNIPVIEQMGKSVHGTPSYFEILLALAFQYFARENVAIAVVEVGLGGRFDATNTLQPLLSIITNISLDHTDILGNTIEKIAREKAGIIKRAQSSVLRAQNMHQPVVTGVKQKSVIEIIERKCEEMGAEVLKSGKDFDFRIKEEGRRGSVFYFYSRNTRFDNIFLSLIGAHQVENASIAIEAALKLKQFGFAVSEGAIRKAFKTATFPGRFEKLFLARSPAFSASWRITAGKPARGNFQLSTFNFQLILDGAHNPSKMRAFISSLQKLYPKQRKIFIVAFKYDKNVNKMLRVLLPAAETLIITQFTLSTDVSKKAALSVEKLRAQSSELRAKKRMRVFAEVSAKDALDKAFEIVRKGQGIIVVTGSLYLVGQIKNYIDEGS